MQLSLKRAVEVIDVIMTSHLAVLRPPETRVENSGPRHQRHGRRPCNRYRRQPRRHCQQRNRYRTHQRLRLPPRPLQIHRPQLRHVYELSRRGPAVMDSQREQLPARGVLATGRPSDPEQCPKCLGTARWGQALPYWSISAVRSTSFQASSLLSAVSTFSSRMIETPPLIETQPVQSVLC